MEIPISLIGLANLERDAEFKVSIDTRNSTAKLGVHFNMDEIQYFKKDSVRGTIKIDFIRSALIRDMQYKLYLHLEANDEYVPTNKTMCTVLFGDITLAQPKCGCRIDWVLIHKRNLYSSLNILGRQRILFRHCIRLS